MPLISAPDLSALLGQADLLLLDCRHDLYHPAAGRQAHAEAHLPGAHFLHADEDLSGPIIPGETGRHPLPDPAVFRALMGSLGLRPEHTVVAYDDKGGGIAARAWWLLRALGHEKVMVLDGGYPAWVAAGLPTDANPVNRPGGAPPSHLAPHYQLSTCDRAQVATLPADFLLIDSRTAPRYRGEEEDVDPIAGHIPGAINLPWPENLQDGRFKSREALKIRFADLRDEADHNVFYCGSGVTACHNILAYYYAFGEMPALYPGSWSEWITPA
ncbi:sulfurtransferase [Neolewinella lacunae]|uniref:Sulfurtransferase n=1 Tax=Neolewinella lacunae TaxID=1517758 RepID=A0A923PKQ4_9BACT|nr:sulfurtransferase [Neolewinella lacunae]MBC6995933.1 sulfurtransferase [Neolewinella lacunae]MDN3635223.1 sulfurtransferase [Neolewinella lacunae]